MSSPGDMDMDDSDKLNLIMQRLNKLDVLEMINQRLQSIEENVNSMSKRLGDLEQSKEFIAAEMDKKVNTSDFDKLAAQVDDMANRMRRNNVVLFNVPEQAEGDGEGNQGQKCVVFVKKFIKDHLKLEEEVEIERAHRTPTRVNQAKTKDKPRPIHVAFLRYGDRQKVLYAAKNLKTYPYPDAKVIVAEDLSQKLQVERRKLWKKRWELLQEEPDRKVYVNFPTTLRVVEPDGTTKQIKASEL